MLFHRFLAVTVVLAAAAAALAPAARAADAKAGRALAESWCAGCHAIGNDAQSSASDAAPTFPSIADRGDTTEESLRTFLSEPHASAMKGIVLPRIEIDNLVAYIMSLRAP